MTDRPIIFSGPMVRALLDGRKTQTRRIQKLPTKTSDGLPIYEHPKMGGWEPSTVGGGSSFTLSKSGEKIPAPVKVAIWHRTCGVCISTRYQPGDRLWVRESLRLDDDCTRAGWRYAADDEDLVIPKLMGAWANKQQRLGVPSIHMPRWASRLTLIVTGVKVERVQAISDADAIAEGVESYRASWTQKEAGLAFLRGTEAAVETKEGTVAQRLFYLLWTGINGEESWRTNPWVVALSFTVHKQNIDAMSKSEAA